MPKFHEVYGYDVYNNAPDVVSGRKSALCPFTKCHCDGGGNRHQTKINLSKSELKEFFNSDIQTVIPGICSIDYGGQEWVVCPRRLFGFGA